VFHQTTKKIKIHSAVMDQNLVQERTKRLVQ